MSSNLITCSRCHKVYAKTHALCPYCTPPDAEPSAETSGSGYLGLGITIGVIAIVLAVALKACSGGGNANKTEAPKTPEQIRAEIIADEQAARVVAQDHAKLKAYLMAATRRQLTGIFESCQSEIMKQASQGRRASDVVLIDEYAADSYQVAAMMEGGHVESTKDRINNFMKQRKQGQGNLEYNLNLFYTVMYPTYSPFSEKPKLAMANYSCMLEPDLKVSAHKMSEN